jgi:hypothetical protein
MHTNHRHVIFPRLKKLHLDYADISVGRSDTFSDFCEYYYCVLCRYVCWNNDINVKFLFDFITPSWLLDDHKGSNAKCAGADPTEHIFSNFTHMYLFVRFSRKYVYFLQICEKLILPNLYKYL